MKIAQFDTDKEVFIVAEIGNNHEGDFTLAQDLVGYAAKAGVNAVKFQTIIPEEFITSTDVERLKKLRKFQLSYPQFKSLAQLARDLGVIFFSTPFDLKSAKFLNEIQPIFKVSSGDNTFIPLINQIANYNKPTLISTGLADMLQIDKIYETWQKKGRLCDLAFLHCVSCYPTPLNEANLNAILALKARYPELVIGYSDHTLGIEAAKLSVAVGARIIEKHFTLNKNYSDFRDHQLSANPKEMKQLVQMIREVESALGTGIKTAQPCESDLRIAARRSIAASCDIPVGTQLTINNITWLRPGEGIAVGDEQLVIGRFVIRELKKGELITLEKLSST